MKVERSVVLPARPDQVWLAVTDAQRLTAWMDGRVELDARPGGRVVVADEDGERWGTVELFEPDHRLVLRLWERSTDLAGSRIEFALDETEEGTRLTVVESRLGWGMAWGAGGALQPALMSRG